VTRSATKTEWCTVVVLDLDELEDRAAGSKRAATYEK
jgi:hypothetical protein